MSVSIRRWDDPTSWNRFVGSVPFAHFQQAWPWGDLAPQLGGEAVRLAALDGGELQGAMQVFVNRIGGSGRTMLYVPRGPALASPSVQIAAPLFDAARQLGRQRQSLGIRVETNWPETDPGMADLLTRLRFHRSFPPSQPRSSWLLDLEPDEVTLLGAMKQKTRYNIRLATRKGVKICEADDSDLDAFYCLYRETAKRDDFFVHPKEIYRRMFDLFRHAGMFTMLFAVFEDRLIAAVTLVRLGDTCWYLHGASSSEHRNLMAPHLLQWEGIRRAKSWGCRVYDFRAVPDALRPDQDMYGVFRFKEGFGGRQFTTLHTFSHAYSHGMFGLWQAYFSGRFALDAHRRSRRGLPARQFA